MSEITEVLVFLAEDEKGTYTRIEKRFPLPQIVRLNQMSGSPDAVTDFLRTANTEIRAVKDEILTALKHSLASVSPRVEADDGHLVMFATLFGPVPDKFLGPRVS